MSKFSNEYNINVDNTYPFNLRLTPIALLMFVQDTVARFLTSKNLASFHIIKDNLIWIIKEMNIDLIKDLPFWTEDIKIEIWVSEISVLKVYTDCKVYHNDELIAQGNGYVEDRTTSDKICRNRSGSERVAHNLGTFCRKISCICQIGK